MSFSRALFRCLGLILLLDITAHTLADQQTPPSQSEAATAEWQTLLDTLESTDKPDVKQIRRLIDAGADVNAVDKKYGRTLLRIVAFSGCPEVVKLLIDAGADVNATDNSYESSPIQAHLKTAMWKLLNCYLPQKQMSICRVKMASLL